MDAVPIWAQILGLVVLLLISGFFSISETAMMALSRYRIRHMASAGNRRATLVLSLLEQTERLLGVILLGNNLVNTATSALAATFAIHYFGENEYALAIASTAVAFAIIIFAELTPKVIGASYPERIALLIAPVLRLLTIVMNPLVWLTNLVVRRLLRLLRVPEKPAENAISAEELRTIVLEGGNFIPQKHKSILLNLFGLEQISVEDVMTPRAQIEALNLAVPVEEIVRELTTCYHNKLPVYEGEINRIVGILHVRKAMALFNRGDELTVEDFRALLTPPYFIPEDTGVFTQLQYFQENHERLGIIVDEYGEVQGLVTLEDIIEEMIGEFTTSMPGAARADSFCWNGNGECMLEGATSLREINKHLGLDLPLDGPKTLNGLLLEALRDIPEANVALKMKGCVVETIQLQNQAIKVVKLIRI
ncbi:HlyC/CorC family transporter [Noviherbaspirillum denitrificans]|uniref:Magnesium and cobalt efflux protein CorC n=1 Tax=Noviherbaspirillum denitrificans TaxID=1968433 RepID=A0A254TS27_9BURK|nr:HlyC/CorC family transporter [Noviherbaspirillum denitrificans]OWW22528.1 magnesium and cobalt efflux protein CorC [Noviherbaspirillum denitrificans]